MGFEHGVTPLNRKRDSFFSNEGGEESARGESQGLTRPSCGEYGKGHFLRASGK